MIWIISAASAFLLAGVALLAVIQWKRKSLYGKIDFMVSFVLLYYNLTKKPSEKISVPQRRVKLEADLRAAAGPFPVRVAGIRDTSIKLKTHEIPIRIYNTRKPPHTPLMIYYHGGGFIIGGIKAYDNTARLLAARTGAIVISVDYRLAPENPFPAGIKDAYAVLKWTYKQAAALGGDRSKIMVCGDSAGANLATVVCQISRDKQGPPVSYQILLYPWTNLDRLKTTSFERFKTGYILTGLELEEYRGHYLTDQEQRKHPYASPALSNNLTGLPEAVIITAGFDPLLDDGETYSATLRTAGNKVSYLCQLGSIHGYMSMRGFLKKQIEATMQFINKTIRESREVQQSTAAGKPT